jgi:aminocarboxymuconate-semialdehyde decarboxylase
VGAEIVYPTLAMMGHSAVRDPDLAAAHARAYNRFASERAHPRVLPALICPLNHPQQAIDEMEHAAAELGLGVLLMTAVPPPGLAWSSRALDGLWSAVADLDLTVTIQDSSLSAGAGSTGMRGEHSWRLLYLGAHVVDAQLALADLLVGGVLARHPTLRIGLQETHVSWLPGWLRLLDERFAPRRGDDVLPSERFIANCFVSAFPDEPGVQELVSSGGGGNLVFASDWPHRALDPSADPDWVRVVQARTDLDRATTGVALATNPRRWFRGLPS